MSETSSSETRQKTNTLMLNDSVYLDTATNMVVLVVDRVTLTLSLQEYVKIASHIASSMTFIQSFVAIKSSLVSTRNKAKMMHPVSSGSTII